MQSDFRWGSFSIKKMCMEVLMNFWMVIAVMIITFLGVDLLDRVIFTPVYTSESIVAVYPFDTLYTLDAASDTWDAVVSVSSVLNSNMFKTGLEAQLGEMNGRTFYSEQINNTNMLKLKVESPDPADAYRTIRMAINYFDMFSMRLPEQSKLEILLQPEVPVKASGRSQLRKYIALLTLFTGFAMGGMLVLLYIARPTYKTVGAFKRYYKDVRCFVLSPLVKERKLIFRKDSSKKKKKREKDIRTATVELRQILKRYGKKSVLLTSADPADGKEELVVSMAKELSDQGYKVVLVDSDFKRLSLEHFFSTFEYLPRGSVQDILKGKCTVEEVAVGIPGEGMQIIFAGEKSNEDDYYYTADDITSLLDTLGSVADVILVNGETWNSKDNVRIWSESVDVTVAVCSQDKADFHTIDVMVEEIRKGNSVFAGCVLNGFV